MTLRPVLKYPDPRLRRPALPVQQFDDQLAALADDMIETMYATGGIGLAAPQIDQSLRLVVVDLSKGRKRQPEVLVNPSYRPFADAGGQRRHSIQEGCLSVPLLRVSVRRYADIEFEYQDLQGQWHREQPQELRCLCLQHELDHLDGRLLVDYLSRMQRERYRKLLKRTGNSSVAGGSPTADDEDLYIELEAAQAPLYTDGTAANKLVSVSRV